MADTNSIRAKLRKAAEASGMTQQQLGEAMGFGKGAARQAVSRLLNPKEEYDPRLSTLVSFANALKKPLKELL